MANEKLKDALALSKKLAEQTSSPSSRATRVSSQPRMMTSQQLDEQINIWDDEVFGKPKPPQKGEYSADVEMDNIKKRQNENIGKTLNNPILQEVFNNPYDMDIDVITGLADPKRQQFDEKLKENVKGGLSNAIKINEVIQKKDQEKVEQKKSQTTTVNSINYEMLQEMIETAIDKKINELKTAILNESVNTKKSNNISMIMLEDTFKFVDSEGNVYQSEGLKRVGRLKMKK